MIYENSPFSSGFSALASVKPPVAAGGHCQASTAHKKTHFKNLSAVLRLGSSTAHALR